MSISRAVGIAEIGADDRTQRHQRERDTCCDVRRPFREIVRSKAAFAPDRMAMSAA